MLGDERLGCKALIVGFRELWPLGKIADVCFTVVLELTELRCARRLSSR